MVEEIWIEKEIRLTPENVEWMGRLGAAVIKEDHDYKLARVLNSFDMYTMNGDSSVSPHLVNDGYWESWITSWIFNNVDADTDFYDVGANTGYYAFLAASLGASVVAFEPNIAYHEMMLCSMGTNGFLMPVVSKAVSDKIGTAVLSVPDTLHGSGSITTDFVGSQWGGSNFEVSTTTLDIIIGELPPRRSKAVVKIDAEGAEQMIWNGAANMRESMAPTFLLEWTPESYSDDFYSCLTEYGDVMWLNHAGEEQPVDKDWLDWQTDWQMLVIRSRS